MSSILLNIVNQELCIRLTRSLLNLIWYGTVIGMCAFAMARFHRTATAKMRYGIHAAALALLALCAAVTFACIRPADRRTSESVALSDIKPISSTATTASDCCAFVSRVLRMEPTQSQKKTADGIGFLAAALGPQPQAKLVDATAVTKKSRLSDLLREQLLVILSHELAHIRRFDSLVNLLQRLLESILFFHPAVWYLSRQLSVERENCCDDAVVRAGNESTRYASALIRMAELCASSRRPVSANELAALAASGSSDSQLTLRILRLLDGDPRPRPTRTDALAQALMVALIAATIAGAWHQAAAARATAFNAHATATSRLDGRVVNPDGKPMALAADTIRRLKRDRWLLLSR